MKRCSECGAPIIDEQSCLIRDFGIFCGIRCLASFRGDWECEYEDDEEE